MTHPPTGAAAEPLTDAQIEQGRRETFSTENPFCPCDSKTMRKAVRWAERAHGIGVIRAALASAPHPPSNTLGVPAQAPSGSVVASLPAIPIAAGEGRSDSANKEN